MRVQLLNRVFQEQDSSDLIRQIELACAKYTRMISTLLGDSAGLAIALQQHVRERVFPDRKLRKRAPDIDIAAFDAACNDVRRLAAISEAEKPVSFARHNPISSFPSTLLGRTPWFTSLPFGLLVSHFGPPCPLGWALFAPVCTY